MCLQEDAVCINMMDTSERDVAGLSGYHCWMKTKVSNMVRMLEFLKVLRAWRAGPDSRCLKGASVEIVSFGAHSSCESLSGVYS